jgi:hypothetical protein
MSIRESVTVELAYLRAPVSKRRNRTGQGIVA